jgi:trans-2,3-dihydro-3-hydroxyanthranilate isomerase
MTYLDYRVVDVFTERAFAGNQLAVVLGGDGLSTAQCQLLAAEFHLSETTFPVRSTAAGADYRLRIFTPTAELPFAGHPSIGTAWVQRDVGALAATATSVVQECGAGLLPLAFRADGTVELTGGEPVVAEPLSARLTADLLAGCGLGHEEPTHAARVASCGVPYAVVPVRPAAVALARAGGELSAAIEATSQHGVLLVAWNPTTRTAHVRMFAPNVGVVEDPAPGSAVVALGAYLVVEGLLPAHGESLFGVRQGAEIGRPSVLAGSVTASSGRPISCRVAGHVAPVAEGRIRVPVR